MTNEQKQSIHNMRRQGLGYTQIADSTGISVNTIKSFCRRNNLTTYNASKDTGNKENKDLCKQCGKQLKQIPKAKPKTFCCDMCRFDWWNTNRNKMNRNSTHHLTCIYCGKVFDSYDKNRKYCGHSCYIADRFGGRAHHDERAI